MSGHILLIEDNEQNRYLITFLLTNHGHEVVAAQNALDGIAKARETTPALILLDIQLPGMDGYSVARTLRGDPGLRGVPLVAVTSYAMPGDREKAMAVGFTGYIEKPIDPDTFVSEVESHLENRSET